MWNWCWSVVLASAVLGASSSDQEARVRAKRLTTFGKSAPVPSQLPSTAGIVVNGGNQQRQQAARDCVASEDCEQIQYTDCRTDPRDGRRRCLCLDNSPPINGACSARPRDTRGYVPLGIRRPNKETTRYSERRRLGLLLISTENTEIVPAATGNKRPPTLFWPDDEDPNYRSEDDDAMMETQLPLPSSQIPTIFRPYIRKPPQQPSIALRSPCASDTECIEGAECTINPNATVNQNVRMCYCMPGWIEIDNACSGSFRKIGEMLFVISSTLTSFIIYHQSARFSLSSSAYSSISV